MKTRQISSAAAILLLMNMACFAEAAEPEKEVSFFYLDDIIVTATTTPNTVKRTNASVYVVTREDIEQNHYTTLREALDNVPGVNSITYGEGIGYEISGESNLRMRGTSGVVVVVDGVRQRTGSGFRTFLFNMNMDDIERIEVLRGSASTLYGADAVGGVINIVTRKKYDGQHGKAVVSVGNYGRQNYHVNHRGEADNVFWSVSYDKSKRGSYKDGYGNRYETDLNQDTVDLKAGVHLSPVTDLTVKHHWSHRDGDSIYFYPKTGDYRWGGNYYTRMTTAILDYHKKDDSEANSLAFSYGAFKSDRKRGYIGKPYATWEETDRSSYLVSDRYYKRLSDNNRLSAGFEWQKYSVASKTAPNRWIREHSVYIQDEWDITKKWNLTAGLRYVHSDSYAKQYLDSESLSYAFNDNYSVYISSSEFYVTPSTTAIFGNTTGFIPNKDIVPTSGRNNEVGFKAKFSKNTQLDFSLFDRKHKNAIVIGRFPTYSQYVNINGASHVKGGEINLMQKFGKAWTARLGYARVAADDDSQILYVPQTQFTFDLNYRSKKLTAGLQAINRSDFMPGNVTRSKDIALPEKNYWVWNLSANYKFDKNWKGFAKVYNLFNKGYMSYTTLNTKWAAGDPELEQWRYFGGQGRSFIAGVEYTF